jgi:hypothetical protein
MLLRSGLTLSLSASLGLLLAIPARLTLQQKAPQPATTVASANAKKSAPEPPAKPSATQIDLSKLLR